MADKQVIEIVYTVNPGIEDVAADEVRAEFGGVVKYEVMSGHVYQSTVELRSESLYRLKSINKAFKLIWRTRIGRRLEDLIVFRDNLLSALKNMDIEEYITPHTTFAVDTERLGSHCFTSMDISRVVGSVIQKVVEERTGKKPPVDLRKPSVIVHVFVRESEALLGISLTSSVSMHRRGYRIYDHPAALKPTLAYAMLAIANTRDGEVIVDPMCGGGTIPIEAGLFHEDAEIYGLDISRKYVELSRRNAYAAGVYGLVKFMQWDARKIHEVSLPSIDHIISNPPYGIRYGDPWAVRRLYREFLESAYKILASGGKLTIITTEYSYVNRIAEKIGYIKVHERVVQHGGIYPHIVVLSR